LKAAAIAAVTAAAFSYVGDLTPGAGEAFDSPKFSPTAYAENVAGHAVVGCASSVASGGSCKSGAMAAATGSALSPLTNTLFPDAHTNLAQRMGGTIIQATAGGLASVAGGGKFANGAITSAFGYLANDLSVDKDGHLHWSPSAMGGEQDMYEMFTADPKYTYPLLAPLATFAPQLAGVLRAVLDDLRSPTVQFGGNDNQVYHTFRHIDELGLNRTDVSNAIRADIGNMKVSPGQNVTGNVSISGTPLEYRAYGLSDGTINVGRITGPK
jgi:hypothetical protein